MLQNKVDSLLARWEEKWEKVEARNERERSAGSAIDATRDAQEILNECERLLVQTLSVDDRVNWETLKCHKPFKWEFGHRIPHLQYSDKTGEPIFIVEAAKPRKPSMGDPAIAPVITFFDKIFKSSKRKKEKEAEQRLMSATKLYEPKACFKALKGVAAASLAQVVPIRPLLQMNHDDPRFVDSYGVADQLDESVNLAAMEWEDFEHLVRELFGKIFTGDGAEVRITQASRDGGVDAVAFDPDPIRGGKIVIQAKRYTATVGVSAVRDLYGTIMNEGAIKGILVTTSNFGPDAHSFAADKPITLLNGSNLLSLLADHGHRAKIDIKEARRLRDQ